MSPTWPRVEIVYEDPDMLVLSKPAGLLVAPDRWRRGEENLMGLLLGGIRAGKTWAREMNLTYVSNAHRLDRWTSGVFLLAKNKAALVHLVRQLNNRSVRKVYVALVHGRIEEDTIDIEAPVSPDHRSPGLSAVDGKHGKEALTKVTSLTRFRRHTLLSVEIRTGRHHQIRAHMKWIGHPIVGDVEYGGEALLLSRLKRHYKMKDEGERPLLSHPALHAARVEVLQPSTGEPVAIEAPWPKDLQVAVKYLTRFDA